VADLVLPPTLAVWDPLGGTPEPLMTGHDGICWHTMAGTFVGTDAYFHNDGWGGTESTVGIAGSGYCKQWTPWNRQADANLEGNPRWLSIECADYGESFPPASTASDESPPMTEAQLEVGIQLCVYWCDVRNHAACPASWRCHSEGIPARFIASSCERGIGCHYHGIEGRGLVAGCPRWSSSPGKICNRLVRLRQVRDRVVPEVQRRLALLPIVDPEEFSEMPYPVVRCDPADPQYPGRERWLALNPNGALHVHNMEYYSVGVWSGLLAPYRVGNARQYDVSADLARRLADPALAI